MSESVISYKIAKTPLYFFSPLFTLVLCLTFFITSPLTLGAVIWLLYRLLRYKKDTLLINATELVAQQGLWQPDKVIIPLAQIRAVFLEQSLFGKITGYGDIILQTEGKKSFRFNYLPTPQKILHIIKPPAHPHSSEPAAFKR